MAFEPNNISDKHVLQAVAKIESEQLELTPSSRWLVNVNDKMYPPKEIMRFAHEQMNGEKIWHNSGGDATNKLFEKMGFPITDKFSSPLEELIVKYKSHTKENGLKGEIYKWELLEQYKGRPDTSAKDFYEEIKGINFFNLIYPVGITVVHHLAKDRTDAYRACFNVLFDESKPLTDRIKYFNEETLKLYRELVPEEKFSHHQDERTIATFLTFHNPDVYTFYKDSFYQKLCKLIGIKSKKKGEKYVHYLQLVNDFIEEYIIGDEELMTLVSSQQGANLFNDKGYKILAQDILYQTLDKQVSVGRNYWRIDTSDGKDNYWNYMHSNNKVCIGWSDIGDLNEQDLKTKKDVGVLLKGKGYYIGDNPTLGKKAGEIFSFYNDVKIGDVVLAQDGGKVLGIGIVNDEYEFNANEGFSHQKNIEWKVVDPSLGNTEGIRTTVYRLTDLALRNQVDALLENTILLPNQNSQSISMNTAPLNQILFGPPGTGKTYQTINKALEIIGENIEGKSRKEIKDLFDFKLKAGQIVFTTFHQSMTYEDFIEGIKPLEQEQGDTFLKYEVTNGIFKQICLNAQLKNVEDFDKAYNLLVTDLATLQDGEILHLKTAEGKDLGITLNSKGNLNLHKGTEMKKIGALTKEGIKKELNGDKYYKLWLVFYNTVMDYLRDKYNFKKDSQTQTSKSFVLIIDEINRGNVSQIFGELITLIEDDKRLGKEEALEVTLPYSKEKFGVPLNLYIIGTMNTADRSVEALDAALRRRFCFEEMPPKYDLKELDYDFAGNKASEILRTINKRIEKLLDKDHAIGHSYFLLKDGVLPNEKLISSFYRSIIPLLQEYFFGDCGKIGMVLGKGFITQKEWDKNKDSFADFDAESSSDYDDKPVYRIIDYTNPFTNHSITVKKEKVDISVQMNFEKAIKLLMKQPIA